MKLINLINYFRKQSKINNRMFPEEKKDRKFKVTELRRQNLIAHQSPLRPTSNQTTSGLKIWGKLRSIQKKKLCKKRQNNASTEQPINHLQLTRN